MESEKSMENLPTVVPAECILYLSPLCFKSLWTSAICCETDAVGVPRGMRQKSAVHLAGVSMVDIKDMTTSLSNDREVEKEVEIDELD
jgi:hypothetical protein